MNWRQWTRADYSLGHVWSQYPFDTVNHSILLRWLEVSFGIRSVALNWFASYLSSKSQRVPAHGILALSTFLEYGVPQGSGLGPILFLLYTADLVSWVHTSDLLHIGLLPSSPREEHIALQRFRSCSDSVSRRMSSNRLKLDPSKTRVDLVT